MDSQYNVCYEQFKRSYNKLLKNEPVQNKKKEDYASLLKSIYERLDEMTFEIHDFFESLNDSELHDNETLYELNKQKVIYPQLCQAMILLSLQLSSEYDAIHQSSSISTSSSSSSSGSISSSSSTTISSSSFSSSSSTNAY